MTKTILTEEKKNIQNQVMWNRLLSVVEEQGQTLIRTAFSPIVRECGDISAGVFDLEGRMMAQAVTGTPGHVNSMAESVKGIKISTHYLRHTAITLALELGEPLQKVQAYARHASANTTVRYFHDQQLLEKNPTDTLPAL